MESVYLQELFPKSMHLDSLMTRTQEIKNCYFRVELEQGEKALERKKKIQNYVSILHSVKMK